MLGWSLLVQPDFSISKYPPETPDPFRPQSSGRVRTSGDIAFLKKISEGEELGVEVEALEESVVVVVRHTGVLDIMMG